MFQVLPRTKKLMRVRQIRKLIPRKPLDQLSIPSKDTPRKRKSNFMAVASGTGLLKTHTFIDWSTLNLFDYNSTFVQRVWIAQEAKEMKYQYIEVDPYKKPESLLEVNPRGLVPALRHGDWATYESTVIMEYVSGSEPATFDSLVVPAHSHFL